MSTVRRLLQVKGHDVWSIAPGATVYSALKMMADKDVGSLLVMEEDRLLGIITERDYARKVILKGKSSKVTAVREIMTETLHPIHPDQTIEECMALMTTHRTRHLPVVDHEKVYGVVSLGDVVNYKLHKQRETIKNLEEKLSKVKAEVE